MAERQLFIPVTDKPICNKPSAKVTIVGTGQVGMAAAFSIMLQGVADEIALVDVVKDKLLGEVLDLQHSQQFLKKCRIRGDTDYKVSENSRIVFVTAGARQNEGESRLNLIQRNVEIFKHIIPNIVKYSPDCILVVVSNPVDLLTYVAWKISGLPKHQVLGSGTMLDSARFRYLLGEKLNLNPSSCHGYIIGEHGDSSVAVWSTVNVAGVTLKTFIPNIGNNDDPEKFGDIHKTVINSAYDIIKLKGYTSWAIGVAISTLCTALLKNEHNIYTLSTNSKGILGITQDIFLSLPCVVTKDGINRVIPPVLSDEEIKRLHLSAKTLDEISQGIKW